MWLLVCVEAIKLSNSGQKDDFKTHNKVIDSLMKEQDELSKKYLRLLEENERLKAQIEKMKCCSNCKHVRACCCKVACESRDYCYWELAE